jgi:hypothetical protein|tara:strand:+ start:1110 stop:1376 length:267 start_codon:yes stop_codon:yes gene_type:complete
MKLNNKEQSWYEKYHKKSGTIQERSKDYKAVDPYSEEGQKLQNDNAKKHGRAWYIFAGMNFRHNRVKKTWIEQFYVKGKRSPNEKKVL